MDSLQLKLFLSVSKTLSFTKTAGEFFMSQPTVSNHIKALEHSLGVKLLNRDSRSVVLTQEGTEFIGYARKMLNLELETENRLKNISKGKRGYLRIAILSSLVGLFSECFVEFYRHYRDVQIDVDILEGAEMMRSIHQGVYDVYFANDYMIPANSDIRHIETGAEYLNLLVHKDLANRINLSDWQSISNLHFVSVYDTDFKLSVQIKSICASRGIVPDIINYYNRADILLLAVNSKIGITILPPSIMHIYNFPDIAAFPIEDDDALIRSVIAWNKGENNPHAAKFIELYTSKTRHSDSPGVSK